MHNKTIHSQYRYVVLPELFESKKCVKNDTPFINDYQLWLIFLLNDEPCVSKLIKFILFLCDILWIAPAWHPAHQLIIHKAESYRVNRFFTDLWLIENWTLPIFNFFITTGMIHQQKYLSLISLYCEKIIQLSL